MVTVQGLQASANKSVQYTVRGKEGREGETEKCGAVMHCY